MWVIAWRDDPTGTLAKGFGRSRRGCPVHSRPARRKALATKGLGPIAHTEGSQYEGGP